MISMVDKEERDEDAVPYNVEGHKLRDQEAEEADAQDEKPAKPVANRPTTPPKK